MSGEVTTLPARSRGDDHVLGCAEAAALLEVAPRALTAWSERLSFPADVGQTGVPTFRRIEIEALRDALPLAHSVPGAIQVARQRVQPG